jgi:hypothetical protein
VNREVRLGNRGAVVFIRVPDQKLRMSGAVHGSPPHRVSEPSRQSHCIAAGLAGAPMAAHVA